MFQQHKILSLNQVECDVHVIEFEVDHRCVITLLAMSVCLSVLYVSMCVKS